MPVKLNCVTCNNEFHVDPYRVKENARYCSRECFLKKWENRFVFNCKNCGNEHSAYGHTKERKKYCSRKCMEEDKHTPLDQLLMKNIDKVDCGCWNWTGHLAGKTGYGKIAYDGKTLGAHRVSYIVFKGEIPKGKQICHSCDNKKCVNPDHLWVGSARDNMQDMVKKGRKTDQTGKRIKHSIEIVKEIKRLKNEGKTYVEIYKITNVPIGTCSAIVNGERRKNISP